MGRHILVLLGLLLITTTLFWRVIFLGETFIDLAAQSRQLPWGSRIDGYDGYPFNHRDLTDTYVTRDYFLVESYRRGEVPLWNPYNLSGHPIYADGVMRPYAPTNLFYLWCDVAWGYSLARLTEYYLASVFLYIFLVGIGLRPVAAATGALAFLLSDHMLYHLTWIGWTGGLMWLPLVLLGAERAMRRRSWRAAIGAGMAFAMQFYTGFIPATVYYLGALVLYYIAMPLLAESDRLEQLKKSLLYTVVTLTVGFGLSAPVWMPVFELLSYSNRKIVPTELGYIWIPPWHLVTLLLPRAFGEAFDPNYLKMFVEMGVSQERSLYLGLTALPLILIALAGHKDRYVYYFAGLLLLSVLTVTCAPIYVHVTKYIPVLKTIRAVTRISCLYALAASALIAYGSQTLLQMQQEQLQKFLSRLRRACLGCISLFMLLVPVLFYLSRYLPKDYEAGGRLRRWPLKVLTAFSMQLDNYGLIVPIAVTVLLLVLTLLRLQSQRVWAAMVVLLVLELVWNGAQYNRTYPRFQVYAPTAATEFLRSHLGHARVLVTPSEIGGKTSERGRRIVAPPNTLIPYGIATISGKDQLFPKWYRTLAAHVEPQEDLSHIVFNSPSSPVYDLLGVRYLMTRADNSLKGYKEVFSGEGVKIYENPQALPRAFFAPEVLSVSTQAEAERLLKGLDLRRTVVVEGDLGSIAGATGQENVCIVEYSHNRLVIETFSPVKSRQLLLVTDTWYPGWEARVDGKPVELLRADGALRALVLTEGRHRVEMFFRPRSLWRGLWIAGIVSFLLLIVGIQGRWKSGRMDRT